MQAITEAPKENATVDTAKIADGECGSAILPNIDTQKDAKRG
jgi:hypothetical protein